MKNLLLTTMLFASTASAIEFTPEQLSQRIDGQGFQFTMSGAENTMRADFSNVWDEGVHLDPAGFMY